MTKSGFSLLSMLLTLMIVSSCFLVVLKNRNEVNVEQINFMNEYINKQSDSLLNGIENDIDEYDIHFNNKGHVNRAQTIKIGNHSIIIHLGNGYASID